MKDQIEELEKTLSKLKEAYKKEEAEKYINSEHKTFKPGDYVTDGTNEGIVGWVENKACNCPESNGMMGVSLLNESMGFMAFARRNEWDLMDQLRVDYYSNDHVVQFKSNGKGINTFLRYMAHNVNPDDGKSSLIDALNEIVKNHTM